MEMRTESSRQKAVGRRKTGLFCFLLSAFCLLAILFSGAALACPACKDAVADNPDSARLTRGFARSIYVLMWTPYILFGGVTFAIVRSARRAKK